MTAADLHTYFPYWDRLQASIGLHNYNYHYNYNCGENLTDLLQDIRTSHLWKLQAKTAGWLAEAPQVGMRICMLQLKSNYDIVCVCVGPTP
jgi:hypothetical protein